MSALPFAPSVQMHEVPGESLSEHLGFSEMVVEENQESEGLDKKLGRKLYFLPLMLRRKKCLIIFGTDQFRRVLNMRRNESSSSDDDGPESPDSDSDDARSSGSRSTSKRHLYPHRFAKRMSLLGSKAPSLGDELDLSRPHGQHREARRFFHSAAVWDPAMRTVVLREGGPRAGMGMGIDYGEPSRMHMGMQMEHAMDVDVDADAEEWRDADVGISVES